MMARLMGSLPDLITIIFNNHHEEILFANANDGQTNG